ncbi:MAG: asparaginase [Candidatus Kerfeldbacteria bacterium]|nr:asparaginase [Candidatus Kerfeldbacteria bacterium]
MKKSSKRTATKKSLPRILVLFCGGTIVMRTDAHGTLQMQSRVEAVNALLELEPKLHNLARLSVRYIANIDSSNIEPAHWDTIAQAIQESYNDYDGFVITHGTNTLGYTASALSFALPKIGKPVVITGAQIPGYKIETDGRRNFVNAVRVALLDIAGVMAVFDEEIILGARASKVSESKLDAFETINGEDLGEIRTHIRLHPDHARRHAEPLQIMTGFNPRVAVVTLTPGFTPSILEHLISTGIHGIILRGYGPGDVPYALLPALKKAQRAKIPVVMTTQCIEGVTAMHMNDVGQQALNAGVIQAFNISLEAAVTKLMWLLPRYNTVEEIKTQLHTNYCGEITTN